MNLQEVLSFSSVTSVSAGGVLGTDSKKDWAYRDINKKIIEKTNALLKRICDCERSIQNVIDEVIDRFGNMPSELENLING